MLFSPKEKGQGLVEYALILVLVAIVVIATLMILGPIMAMYLAKSTAVCQKCKLIRQELKKVYLGGLLFTTSRPSH